MAEDVFVVDAVTHAYNHTPENFADEVGAGAIAGLAYVLASDPPDPKYALSREVYLSDWQVEDVANLLFRESETDVAVMHPLAISAFKDGYVSVEKAAEARERWRRWRYGPVMRRAEPAACMVAAVAFGQPCIPCAGRV